MEIVKIFNLGLNWRGFLFILYILRLIQGIFKNEFETIELGTVKNISLKRIERIVSQVGKNGILLNPFDITSALFAVVSLKVLNSISIVPNEVAIHTIGV